MEFQLNDESVMLKWINKMWKNPFSPLADKPKLLIADVHTERNDHEGTCVQSALEAFTSSLVLVPGGCTSLVQPLDVVVKVTVTHLAN